MGRLLTIRFVTPLLDIAQLSIGASPGSAFAIAR